MRLILHQGKSDIKLLFLSMGYFLVCALCVAFTTALVDQEGVNINSGRKKEDFIILPDWLMESLNRLVGDSLPMKLPDYFVYSSLSFTILGLLLKGEKATLLLRRFLYVTGSVYLLRAPSVIMTILPGPQKSCVQNPDKNILIYTFLVLLQIRPTCGDVFFSGHTIFMMQNAILWVRYFSLVHSVPALVNGILGMLSLIALSYHYTIDVFASALYVIIFDFLYFWGAEGVNQNYTRVIQKIDCCEIKPPV